MAILDFVSCMDEAYGFANNVGYKNYAELGYVIDAEHRIPATYEDDEELAGKVTSVENTYGWQKYVLTSSGEIEFTVRGGSGGCSCFGSTTLNPITGMPQGPTSSDVVKSSRSGRGAKLKGKGKFKKGTTFYFLVGARGFSGQSCQCGGGGASVVLVDNPSGQYTFQPLNRKVDVVFVAGGGGGGYYASPNPNHTKYGSSDQYKYMFDGRDAVYENGTNTNGGAILSFADLNSGKAAQVATGAGLTGDGLKDTSYTQNAQSKNLLSGQVSYIIANTAHLPDRTHGTWGGGAACGQNSAGGGGGYSGGGGGYRIGGDGGTSYINPNYIQETFRGYATAAEDSDMRCANPWAAYGFIRLVTGRNGDKYILAQDEEGYKYYDGEQQYFSGGETYTDEWQLLPSQEEPDEDTYKEYGSAPIENVTGLLPSVRFLVMSSEEEESINIVGNINRVLVKQLEPISASDVKEFLTMVYNGSLSNLTVQFAVSKNQGATWQTYDAGAWIDVNVNNVNQFAVRGYDLALFNSIPIESWNAYKPATVNFAFLITQNGANSEAIIDSVTCTADLVGSWRHYKESEATYQYTTDSELEVTFLQAGNYKVNYLDSLNTGSD